MLCLLFEFCRPGTGSVFLCGVGWTNRFLLLVWQALAVWFERSSLRPNVVVYPTGGPPDFFILKPLTLRWT